MLYTYGARCPRSEESEDSSVADARGALLGGVYNQDDCVAVNSGTDITFKNGFCSGGHGLSIGSVGGRDDNMIDTVTFSNSEVTKSVNRVRVKASAGVTG
ncbi:endo-polygalacturonase precursor [Pyrenophora tritici-repentis]|uniref:Endo-polygalacturonase n=1 Tax=Pyrenophora tritici-repentis TaxID=45151 RepID=A0A834S987_9PLEO|nr:endo-polygalacturonase precursor [Pyrenophora tritici-repentis]